MGREKKREGGREGIEMKDLCRIRARIDTTTGCATGFRQRVFLDRRFRRKFQFCDWNFFFFPFFLFSVSRGSRSRVDYSRIDSQRVEDTCVINSDTPWEGFVNIVESIFIVR